jgi:two-component system, sensor histidine kinase and response regulator
LNILVAEDSDQSYYVTESYLEGKGHRLTRAQNGQIAVDMFKTGCYDLVLMDVHMPVIDGNGALSSGT